MLSATIFIAAVLSMNRSFAHELSRSVRWLACLVSLAALGACGSSHSTHTAARHRYSPSRYYPPPGSASDPWGPYIHEASGRFAVPENWIRRVMRQESGGQEDVISWAGAMGLMQVMPDTYDDLRGRHGLGEDPFDPHNNILAGTAYLKEMYDRFGSPGFLAAYNAGPNRLDRYLNNGTPLPAETVNYVASIAPLLGTEMAMSGPLAVYGGGATVTPVAFRSARGGCDPDAAYDPDRPCAKLRPARVQAAVPAPSRYASTPYASAPYGASPAPSVATASPYAATNCDPDAAYDPTRPCQTRAPVVAQPIEPAVAPTPAARPPARYAGDARPLQERMAQSVAFSQGPPVGHWMIQVGAFATLSTAQAAAENARAAAPDLLGITKIELPATGPLGTQVAFRARLSGLTAQTAAEACGRVIARGIACITVPPVRDSF
jgi:D-alanyl-D-alanine carboxypeptidase